MTKRTATDWISNRDLAIHAVGNKMELVNGNTGEVSAVATIISHGKTRRRVMPITGASWYETQVTYQW